jgi:dTDP-4-dehydrorhamnose reductase
VERSARSAPLEHTIPSPLGTRPDILITGGEGQLGRALREVFPGADAPGRGAFDVTSPSEAFSPGLVLHAAAWTDVDGAEREAVEAERVNVLGTRNVVALGAPVVYFSTDYVFDGAKRAPYVESDEPRPMSVYGRTKLAGEAEVGEGWVIRSSWLYGPTGRNFVRTMLSVAAGREEVRVVDDQRGSPTYVGHLARATAEVLRLPHGLYHVAGDGECTWAEFAEAIFAEAGLRCRVVRVTSAELGRPARRPSYSVLRSENPGTPRLPHWRDGLRACLERLL